ncbi:MAG TPA: type II secretion system protein GspM [Thermodesulfobacteriota bacterium]|nr:type II secretion system protein GspM [Thermodesulfobacteriota bacterium]
MQGRLARLSPARLPLPRLQLARRERWMVGGGAVAVALLLVYALVVAPLLERSRDLDRLIAQKEREYAEIVRLREEYRRARAELAAIEARLARTGADFQLLSFLEGLAARTGVRDRIAYMRPQAAAAAGRFREQAVELRLDGVTINQLVQLLAQVVEAPQALRIKRLSVVTRYDNANRLDVIVQIAAYQRA